MPTANRVDVPIFLAQGRRISVNNAVGPPFCTLGTSSDAATVCAGSPLVRKQRAGVVGMRSRMGDDEILAFGSYLAGLGILVAGLLALLFRNPNPPRWTQPDIVAMLACLPVTGAISIGLGCIAAGLWQLITGGGDPGELLVLAGVAIGLGLVWHVLQIRQRLAAYAAVEGEISPGAYGATEPALPIDDTPPPGPRPPPSGRRAA
jgi:hypothetical protein